MFENHLIFISETKQWTRT